MASNSPGHDADNPSDASAPARNNEDTETPPQQGENTAADDRDNPTGSEVSSNGIDPAQEPEISSEEPDRFSLEERQAPHDISQFKEAEIFLQR